MILISLFSNEERFHIHISHHIQIDSYTKMLVFYKPFLFLPMYMYPIFVSSDVARAVQTEDGQGVRALQMPVARPGRRPVRHPAHAPV